MTPPVWVRLTMRHRPGVMPAANGAEAASPGTAASPYQPNGQDQLTLVPGRSVMVSFQLGFGPKGR